MVRRAADDWQTVNVAGRRRQRRLITVVVIIFKKLISYLAVEITFLYERVNFNSGGFLV